MDTLTRHQKKDIRLIGKFTEVFCIDRHPDAARKDFALPAPLGSRKLCPECAAFMEYAITRRLKCPLEEEKPTCKRCRIHCFAKPQREMVREIMSYAGRKLIMRGRLDYLWHYLF